MYFSKKLKKFDSIRHCFFSRKGGFSKGLYKSLNCGRGSKDNKKNIIKNLSFVAKKMHVKKENLVLMHQTHSKKVVLIKKNNFGRRINSDAVITKVRGLALGVVTADCVPVLVYDYKNKIVGCIHAGWKGAKSGIIENTILKIKKMNSKSLLYASIGPCIAKKSYEVDNNFYLKFIKKSKKMKKYFSKKNKKKMVFDLRKYIADKLLGLNVKIDHVSYDTFAEKNNFFSYRRSFVLNQNDYGRCISVISLI